jgi:radical SAM protein with 4Fe4S-binding SPASM domain
MARSPLGNIIINHSGDVVLCCMDWKYQYMFGNVLDKPLSEIIKSEKFIKTAEATQNGLYDVTLCRHCSGQYYVQIPSAKEMVRPQHINR